MTFSSSFGSRPGVPPLEVRLTRNGIGESLHRVHAVVCDQRGRILMGWRSATAELHPLGPQTLPSPDLCQQWCR